MTKSAAAEAVGNIRFRWAIFNVSIPNVAGNKFFKMTVDDASAIKIIKTAAGIYIYLSFFSSFKKRSKPSAESVTRENTSKKIILEGCMVEIIGQFKT